MKITPKVIVERHKEHPNGTEQLIEAYAFEEYKKAISDLMRVGRVVSVEDSDVTMIIMSDFNFKEWTDLKSSHWYLNKSIDTKER